MSQIDRYNAQTEKKKRSKNSYSFSWIESGGANLLSEVIEEEKRMPNIEQDDGGGGEKLETLTDQDSRKTYQDSNKGGKERNTPMKSKKDHDPNRKIPRPLNLKPTVSA